MRIFSRVASRLILRPRGLQHYWKFEVIILGRRSGGRSGGAPAVGGGRGEAPTTGGGRDEAPAVGFRRGEAPPPRRGAK